MDKGLPDIVTELLNYGPMGLVVATFLLLTRTQMLKIFTDARRDEPPATKADVDALCKKLTDVDLRLQTLEKEASSLTSFLRGSGVLK